MPSSTDEVVAKLQSRPLPPLEPSAPWDAELVQHISALKEHEHEFVIAALHLANDDIERCHLIAQANDGDPTADLLHATLHRREGDYSNSKYWYARTTHPLAAPDAAAFVDACEAAAKTKRRELELRERQWKDIMALVQWSRENCA